MSGRGRVIAVLASLVAAALMLSGSVLPWATVVVEGVEPIPLDGATIAPGLAAVALALGALGFALTLARPLVARILAVVELAIVAVGAVHLVQRASTIDAAVADAASTATGITTATADAATTPAPLVAALGLAVAVAAAAWTLATASRWQRREAGQRFERAESGLAWDALDDGDDPTTRDAAPEAVPDAAGDAARDRDAPRDRDAER